MPREPVSPAAVPSGQGGRGTWANALRRGIAGGSVASLASAVALIAGGRICGCGPYAPLNAPSQWVWGKTALAAYEPSWRHTFVGCMVHHFSSVFWGTAHARWLSPRAQPPSLLGAMAGASATAALACAVDYTLTPPRFRPGFEQHLSRPVLAGVYAALAVGLTASALTWHRRRH